MPKVCHCYAAKLQAQVNCLLTPRVSYSLTWNRLVNHQGAIDTNHPMDLDIEHDNKNFKNDCHSYRGEITDKSIDRVSRSTEKSDSILYNFDEVTSVKRPSGRHTILSTEEDIMLLKFEILGVKGKSKGNKFWFELSVFLRNRGFKKSGFRCSNKHP